MGLLISLLLISVLSLPFFSMLIFLVRSVIRLALPVIQMQARAHFAWRPGSHFLADYYVPLGHGEGAGATTATPSPSDQAKLQVTDLIRLRVSRYELKVEEPSEQAECVFCLSDIEEGEEIRELRCRHLFHRHCLDRWIMHRRAMCPLCRDALVPWEEATAKCPDVDVDELEELDGTTLTFSAFVNNGWWVW